MPYLSPTRTVMVRTSAEQNLAWLLDIYGSAGDAAETTGQAFAFYELRSTKMFSVGVYSQIDEGELECRWSHTKLLTQAPDRMGTCLTCR